MRLSRPALLLPTVVLSAVTLAGCSDDGADAGAGDVQQVKDGLAERAEAAYDAVGRSRADDFEQGVRVDSCFALDEAALEAVAAEIDLGPLQVGGGSYVFGPPEREQLSCTLRSEDGPGPGLGVAVGTTDVGADELAERVVDGDSDRALTPLEGEAEGLDPDDVVAVGDDDTVKLAHVREGLIVSLSAPTDVVDAEAGHAVLPVLVDEITRVLGGE